MHPTTINGFPSVEEAAEAISKLRYDKLAEFLLILANELDEQALQDIEVGRVNLATDMDPVIDMLYDSGDYIYDIFYIYKKYMKDELNV